MQKQLQIFFIISHLLTLMKNFGEFFNNQIENAGTIVISRTQKMKEDKLAKCVAQIKEKNAHATIITTPWDEIDGKIIVNAMEHVALDMQAEHEHEEGCTCGCHDHHHEHGHHHGHEHHHEHGEGCGCGCHDHGHGHHHAEDVFSSWGVETPKKYTEEEMKAILKELSDEDNCGIILRAKGIVPCTDGTWLHFDMVPEEYELRHGEADYTGRICVIGSMLDKEALENNSDYIENELGMVKEDPEKVYVDLPLEDEVYVVEEETKENGWTTLLSSVGRFFSDIFG